MKQIISAKLKLHTTPEQFKALRQAQLAYRDALNHVSRHAFAHHKMSNQRALQKETYEDIRAVYGLPSQMACNVPRQVGATYKGLWKKVKQNAAHRKAGQTKKRYRGLDHPPKYVSPTLTYNYGYDYRFKSEQRVSVLTLQGRVIVPYMGYHKHMALIQHGGRLARPNSGMTSPRSNCTCWSPWKSRWLIPHQSSISASLGSMWVCAIWRSLPR
jgi:putative transposase